MPADVQINLYSLILIFAAGQGLLFAVLMFFKPHQSRAINLHLTLILFSISAEVFHQVLLETGYIHHIRPIVGYILPLDSIIGISLYWYVRITTFPERDNSHQQVLKHYSIFFLCVLLSIPYWLMDYEFKLEMMLTGVVSPDWPWQVFYTISLQVFIKIISFCIYLFLSIRMLLEHKSRINQLFSYRERITLAWLTNMLWLFLFGLIQGISILIFFQESEEVTSMMGFMGLFSVIAIFYIGIMGLMQPRIYHRRERAYIKGLTAEQSKALTEGDCKRHRAPTEQHSVPQTEQNTDSNQESTSVDSASKKKYSKSALSIKDMQRIAKKLDVFMLESSAYLEPDLTMPQLADKLSVSPNYLSQTLNSLYTVSFFDYVNKQRIDYAKILLVEPKNNDKSVIDIAVDSAFNSRSAFYSAFKKHVGMTPTQYKRSMIEST